jgi:hypothetical protein
MFVADKVSLYTDSDYPFVIFKRFLQPTKAAKSLYACVVSVSAAPLFDKFNRYKYLK